VSRSSIPHRDRTEADLTLTSQLVETVGPADVVPGLASSRVPIWRHAWRSPVASSLFTSASIQALSLLTGVILARTFGPHGRGALTAILLWPIILAAVGSLGVSDSITFHASRRTAPVGTLFGTAALLALGQSTLLIGIGLVVIPLVLRPYGTNALHLGLIFLAVIPLNLATLYCMAIVNGLQKYRRFQIVRVLVVVLIAGGLVGLWVMDALTLSAAVIVYLAANSVAAFVAVGLVTHGTELRLGVSLKLARKLLGYGIKSHTSNVAGLLNMQLDQLVISIFLAPARLGLYVIAVTMSSVTNLIGVSVSFVALPAIAHLKRAEERLVAAKRYISGTFVLSAFSTVPVLLFTPQLIKFFFGAEFVAATDACRLVLLAGIVLSTGRVVEAILKAINRPLEAGVAETLALVATVVGLAALLPTMGIVGAGLASLIAYLISTGFALYRASRALETSILSLMVPTRAELLPWRVLEAKGQ
jgi:O-antigen/teichoic acid export membrane protein